ncbi:MAG: hypothetical protein Crog4KO_21930 [Crocinitomicaceae bacterium]
MKLSVFLCLLLSSSALFAQVNERNYRIYVGDDPAILEGDLTSDKIDFHDNTETSFEGKWTYLVQFNAIPTEDQKEACAFYGVELLKYIPNYAWVAKVDTNISTSIFGALNIRRIVPVNEDWKMSSDMRNAIVPAHAGNNQNASVNVLFWAAPNEASFSEILSNYNLNVTSINEDRWTATLNAPVDALVELAKHPFVQYIEFIEPPIEDEGIKEESERIISTYISNNPGKNYFFDGTGVNIAVDEGGILDTLENPNYRSRIVRTYENGTNVGGHKTSVGARMAKAGNIDPREQGTAFGADLYSGGVGTAEASASDIVITN